MFLIAGKNPLDFVQHNAKVAAGVKVGTVAEAEPIQRIDPFQFQIIFI